MNLPNRVRRECISVGSGMMVCGCVCGCVRRKRVVPRKDTVVKVHQERVLWWVKIEWVVCFWCSECRMRTVGAVGVTWAVEKRRAGLESLLMSHMLDLRERHSKHDCHQLIALGLRVPAVHTISSTQNGSRSLGRWDKNYSGTDGENPC